MIARLHLGTGAFCFASARARRHALGRHCRVDFIKKPDGSRIVFFCQMPKGNQYRLSGGILLTGYIKFTDDHCRNDAGSDDAATSAEY